MAFPQTPLAVIVEMLLGGVWTDVTQWVYTRNPITIERGRKEEGKQVDPGRCTVTLNNRDGRWSSRKSDGPYYGLIGRNTQVRVSVDAGASYLATTGTSGGTTGASTPDAAALDITGDIDIRFEATLDNWLASGSVELCGKGAIAGSQRSWLLLMRDRKLHWEWSAAGTSTIEKESTVELPVPPSGRIAVRVTQDVNDGAGNNVVTFYTGPSISGPWTQLGDAVTTAGTTSIFNSSAALRVGDGWSDLSFASSSGAVHAFELRSGIAGSIVANPDFTIQTPGGTSFADGTGKTWTVGSATSISNRKTRFNGEISEWPVRWDVSGKDTEVSVQAAGILRRIGQGNAPLTAALQRHIVANSALECWPLTDGAQAVRGASLFGGSPMAPRLQFGTGPVQWAEGKLADWISPVVQLPAATDGYIPGTAPASTAAASGWSADLSLSGVKSGDVDFTIADRGAGSDADPRFIWYLATNRASNQVLLYCSSISESSSTSPLLATISTAGIYDTNPHHIRLTVVPGGSTTTYTVYLDGVSRATGSHSVVTKAARMLRPGWFLNGATDSTTALGYVTYWGPTAPTAASTYAALIGNQGEAAAVRAERLCGEAGIEFRPSGVPEDTTPLGPQLQETFLEVLQNAAAADSGAVYEDREDVALRFRDRNGLYNQAVTLALDYEADGEVAPPLEPVDDDQATRNDVTVTRAGGSAGRAVLETGALSIQAPPNGVGIYDESVTLSLYTDDQPAQHASWRVHLGTWDEARYPVVHVDLAAAPHLIDDATAVDIGDRLTISNPPEWLPPDLIDLLAQGYTEVLGHPNDWDLRFNCTPAGPWTVGVLDADHVDTGGSELVASISSSATSMTVIATDGETWTRDPADVPFDVTMGGERITATAITGALEDDFSTNQTDSWGTADVGGPWGTGGGAASDFDVVSGRGTHTLTSVNVSRRAFLTGTMPDVDVQADIQTSALATGAAITGGLAARYTDSDNLYTARVAFNTDQTITLTIRERVAAVETQLGTFTAALTHAADTDVRLRFKVTGSTLQAKVWDPLRFEPPFWQIEVTDASLTTSSLIGVRSILNTGNTNVNPLVRYDNFVVLNPTTWTVTRSVNGVTKAHTAGADVRLHQPAIIAL